jgi:hypothetical protein
MLSLGYYVYDKSSSNQLSDVICHAHNSAAKAQTIVLQMVNKGHKKLVTMLVSSPLTQAYTVHIEHKHLKLLPACKLKCGGE